MGIRRVTHYKFRQAAHASLMGKLFYLHKTLPCGLTTTSGSMYSCGKSPADLLIAAPNFCKRAHKTFYFLRSVAYGKIGQYIANISKLNLNVVFVPQNVVYLYSGQSDVSCVDAQFGLVEIIDGILVDQFFAESIISADSVDFLLAYSAISATSAKMVSA